MWLRLQLDENDRHSMLAVAVGANGHFFFRAVDVARLMGWDKRPWPQINRWMPSYRQIREVVPADVPIAYGNTKVVTYSEMIEALENAARSSYLSINRSKSANSVEFVNRVFREGRVVGGGDAYYATNQAKASAFVVVFDERRGSESLEALLVGAKDRFLQMYRRLSVADVRRADPRVETRTESRMEPGDDDEGEGRLVIDESPDVPAEPEKPVADIFRIHCRSEPPAVLEWIVGNATFTFRCVKYSRGSKGENITLYRNSNVLNGQVVERETEYSEMD